MEAVDASIWPISTALLFLTGVWGCGEKGAKLQKSVVRPTSPCTRLAVNYLKKSQYIKARWRSRPSLTHIPTATCLQILSRNRRLIL